MAMCQFGDVENALFSRYDFNKSSVLFNRLHRTVVGGTFVQMACNRLNPLLRSFSFLQTVCTDGDLSLSVVIFFNPDLCICLFLKSLNHFSTRANHRTDTVAVEDRKSTRLNSSHVATSTAFSVCKTKNTI